MVLGCGGICMIKFISGSTVDTVQEAFDRINDYYVSGNADGLTFRAEDDIKDSDETTAPSVQDEDDAPAVANRYAHGRSSRLKHLLKRLIRKLTRWFAKDPAD